jgi:predicted RNA-binding protein YlxR (DUF448 family)
VSEPWNEVPPPANVQGNPHAPVRLCVGCRERSDRHELLRIVVVPVTDSAPGRWRAEPDVQAKRPGRGAWIHPRIGCFELAERRRAWVRAFRLTAPPDTSAVRQHVEAVQHHSTEESVGAGAAGLPEKAGREAMSAR